MRADPSTPSSLKVSIIIATYGEDQWRQLALDRAFPSATDQGAHEIIVGHDADASIAQVRNALAEKASGTHLLFLDADDTLGEGFLDAMKSAAERQGAEGWGEDGSGWVWSGEVLYTPSVSFVRKGKPAPPKFLDRGISLRDDNWLVVGTLIKRDLFMEIGGFSDYPHGFEDFSAWSKAYRAGARIVKVPGAVYYAHVNRNSKHRTGWRDQKWQLATHQRVIRELDEWEAARA